MNLGSASRLFLLFSALVAAASSFGCATGSVLTPNGEGGDGAAGGSGTSNNGGGGSNDTNMTTTSDTTSSSSSTSTTTSTFTNTTTSTFTNTTTSTFTNTTTSVGGTCDDTGDCNTCAMCAQNDTCLLETTFCLFDPDCLDFETCVQACAQGDQACIDACISQYPIGSQEYIDYLSCVICVACYNDCDGASSCM